MSEQSMKTIVNQKPDKEPIPAQVLADSIVEIGKAFRAINATRLRRSAIVALVHDKSKIAKRDIEIVLNNLDDLERDWLKP